VEVRGIRRFDKFFFLLGQDHQLVLDRFDNRSLGCRGSRLVPTAACGSPAFGQYRPNPEGGFKPWALIVLELSGDQIAGVNSFLDTETLFPKFDLAMELPA